MTGTTKLFTVSPSANESTPETLAKSRPAWAEPSAVKYCTETRPSEPPLRTTEITALPTASSTTKFVLAKFSTPAELRLSMIVSVALVSVPSATKLVGTALLNTRPTVRFPSTKPSSSTPTTTVTSLVPAGKVTTWLVG